MYIQTDINSLDTCYWKFFTCHNFLNMSIIPYHKLCNSLKPLRLICLSKHCHYAATGSNLPVLVFIDLSNCYLVKPHRLTNHQYFKRVQ